MASNTEIANLAISHLGIGVEIGSLDTEKSAEAMACRRFYEQARKQTLRDFDWPFATKQVALGLVEQDPSDEWAYAYTYPADCLKLRKILSGLRSDNRQSRIPYQIVYGDASAEIWTDMDLACCEYTADVTSEDRFPQDFIMALSLRLAAYVAPRLTGGDPFKLSGRCMQLYQMELAAARSNAINEQSAEELPDSEFIRTRS